MRLAKIFFSFLFLGVTFSLVLNPGSVLAAPVATSQTITVNENSSIDITLSGTRVIFKETQITSNPTNGSLSKISTFVYRYTPTADYTGSDSFRFKLKNRRNIWSSEATVTITVNNINQAPVASDQSVITYKNHAINITPIATDPDGDALSFVAETNPSHGSLSYSGGVYTYTPTTNYVGSDSFTYSASDSQAGSSHATVSITINSSNSRPTATSLTVDTDEDSSVNLTLNGSDPEGASLTYSLTSTPVSGTLTCVESNCVFTPNSNFNGSATAWYKVSDGSLTSESASISFNIRAVNDLPTANSQTASASEDWDKTIFLSGSDIDGDSLTYVLETNASHGTVTISGNQAVYLPEANFTGSDSFAVKANDGHDLSTEAAIISLTVAPNNDQPTISDQTVTINEDTPLTFALAASDVDGDPLTATIWLSPSGSSYRTKHGSLTVSGINLTYTPDADYNGDDTFSASVTDGAWGSSAATVTLQVQSVNDAPVAKSGWVRSGGGKSALVIASADDVENDPLTYSIVAPPQHGQAFLWNDNRITYVPSPGYAGTDSFTYQASDGITSSAAVPITVDVNPNIQNFPIDLLPLETDLTKTVSGSSIVINFPSGGEECQANVGTPVVIPTNQGKAAAFGTHFKSDNCSSLYENRFARLYVLAHNGSSIGGLPDFDVLRLKDGYNSEAPGTYLEDGTLIFPLTGRGNQEGGGVSLFTSSKAAGDTAIEERLINVLNRMPVDESATPSNGNLYFGSTNVPAQCNDGQALGNDCGAFAVTDLYGNLLQKIDETQDHQAWSIGACAAVDVNPLEGDDVMLCGFGTGSDQASSNAVGMDSCTLKLVDTIDSPEPSLSEISTDVSFLSSIDFGLEGCSAVGDLESAIANGSIITDGTFFYVIPLGSSNANDTMSFYKLAVDARTDEMTIVQEATLPYPGDMSFVLGYYNSGLIGPDGNVYVTGVFYEGPGIRYGVVRWNTATGIVEPIFFSPVGVDESAPSALALLDGLDGESVLAFAKTGSGTIIDLDGNVLESYPLSTNVRHVAAPVAISDGDAMADTLVFMSTNGVVTLYPNTGYVSSTASPWPGVRGGDLRQGTVTIP